MTTEEKAKAYDEVLNKLRYFMAIGVDPLITRADVQDFFPELRESEDERIRKALKEYFINSFQNNGVAAICGVHIKDILAWLKKQGKTSPILSNSPNIGKVEQKPTFKMKTPEESLGIDSDTYSKIVDELIYGEPKQEWSEEDKEIIDYLIDYLESELDSSYTDLDKETFTKEINWLKSLKDRYTWKPSEEQIEALSHMIDAVEDEWDCEEPIGRELLRQLKELRGK